MSSWMVWVPVSEIRHFFNEVYFLHTGIMSFAVNWQLQLKLEIYVENIGLKDDTCDVYT